MNIKKNLIFSAGFLVFFSFTHLWAQESMAPFGSHMGGIGMFEPQSPTFIYGITAEPKEDPSAVTQNRLSISIPITKGEKDSTAASLMGTQLHFSENIVLSSGTVIARDLNKIETGAQYTHKLQNDRFFGGRMGIGSASDNTLFKNSREDIFSLTGFYSFPGSEKSRWVILLFMSNNNPISDYFPIPGFVYIYHTEHFTGMFGFPFASMYWTPINPWAFSLSIFGPTVNLEAIYGHPDELQKVIGFNWLSQMYLRQDRVNIDDRLYFEEKRIFLGLRSHLAANALAEFQLGSSYDRKVYEGLRFLSYDGGLATLDRSWFANLNFRYTY